MVPVGSSCHYHWKRCLWPDSSALPAGQAWPERQHRCSAGGRGCCRGVPRSSNELLPCEADPTCCRDIHPSRVRGEVGLTGTSLRGGHFPGGVTALLSQLLRDPGIDTGVGPPEVSSCHALGDVGQVTSSLSSYSFPTKRDNNTALMVSWRRCKAITTSTHTQELAHGAPRPTCNFRKV